MNAGIDPELLRSPDWLLAGFDSALDTTNHSRYHFAQVTRQTYLQSSFLDHRIQPMPAAKLTVTGEQVDAVIATLHPGSTAWVFHTGFCCSTLLASCLDHPGQTLVLREPLVLSRLAHTQRAQAGAHQAALQEVACRVTALCERTYPGESLVVKPSNFANRLMDLLFPSASPPAGRKAVLMSCGLEALLVSILKKKTEAEASLPAFVGALLQDSDYARAAGLPDISQLDLLQLGVVFWHCQRHFLQARFRHGGGSPFLLLSMERFLAEPSAVLAEVSAFMGLGLGEAAIEHTVESGAFRRHSKQAGQDYDPDMHRKEQREIQTHFAHEIALTLDWARPLLECLPVIPFDSYDPGSGRNSGAT